MRKVLLNWRHTVGTRLRGHHTDRGAGFVEYAGLLLLIAAVVAAVINLNLPADIANAIKNAVLDVLDS